MKNSEILIAARAKIEKLEHWTQGAFARDIVGSALRDGFAKSAVCFCSMGAVEAAVGIHGKVVDDAVYLLYRAYDQCYAVEAFNDSHSHQEVLEMFDKAILLAKAEEG